MFRFLYGLTVGSQFINTGLYNNILVVGVDILSKITDWSDRNTCVLFGDGAGAVILGPVEKGYGFLSFDLGSKGSGGELLIQPAGGSRYPASQETIDQKMHYVQMNGSEVYKFAVKVMETATLSVLEKAGLKKDDIDYLIPHQANIRIIDHAAKNLILIKIR